MRGPAKVDAASMNKPHDDVQAVVPGASLQ